MHPANRLGKCIYTSTIGSGQKTVAGSLLDLKQENPLTPGGVTASKGLGLPRVELQNPTKLKMGSASELTGTTEREAHTGLLVYNVSEVAPFCKGLYVWDSQEWKRLQVPCLHFSVSPAGPLFFPSGWNGNEITAQTLTATWALPAATGGWTNVASSSFGKVNFTNAGAITPTTTAWTSPQIITLKPDAMMATEVSDITGNPFLTKESELTFTVTENGRTEKRTVIVNQTNRAITINNLFIPPIIKDPAASTGNAAILRSNSYWKLAQIVPAAQSAFQSVSVATGTTFGNDRNDGNYDQTTINYNIQTGANTSRYSSLVFSDKAPAASPM